MPIYNKRDKPMEDQAEIEMDTLAGREFDFHGVADNCFRLDGVVYEAIEDPDDGFRSMLECVRVVDAGGRPFFATPVARVTVRASAGADSDTWDLVDAEDGHVWLSLGTESTNDYYPWFQFEYSPKPRETP